MCITYVTYPKPLWDTFHVSRQQTIRGSFNAETALAFTRFSLVLFDSLPQAAAQSLLVASLKPEDRTPLMLVSIGGSILSISYLVATNELSAETSIHGLTNSGRVIGYIPLNHQQHQAIVVLGIVLFTSG